MKATTYLISRAIAALCLLATAACVAEDSPAADDTTLVEIGQTAPDFTVEMTKGGDVTLVANGVEVTEALKAADILAAEGVEAEVIDAYSVKPLDGETILTSLGKTGCAVVAEEHSIHGGLGSAVAELCAEQRPTPLRLVGMRYRFGKSGEFAELLAYFEMDAAAIADAARAVRAKLG